MCDGRHRYDIGWQSHQSQDVHPYVVRKNINWRRRPWYPATRLSTTPGLIHWAYQLLIRRVRTNGHEQCTYAALCEIHIHSNHSVQQDGIRSRIVVLCVASRTRLFSRTDQISRCAQHTTVKQSFYKPSINSAKRNLKSCSASNLIGFRKVGSFGSTKMSFDFSNVALELCPYTIQFFVTTYFCTKKSFIYEIWFYETWMKSQKAMTVSYLQRIHQYHILSYCMNLPLMMHLAKIGNVFHHMLVPVDIGSCCKLKLTSADAITSVLKSKHDFRNKM